MGKKTDDARQTVTADRVKGRDAPIVTAHQRRVLGESPSNR